MASRSKYPEDRSADRPGEIIKPPRPFRIPSNSDIFSVSYCLLQELLPDVYLSLSELLTRKHYADLSAINGRAEDVAVEPIS